MTNRERLERAEVAFAAVTGDGRDLVAHADSGRRFQMADGEVVTGYGPAADAGERLVRFAHNQARQ